jgi:hypothetical protein
MVEHEGMDDAEGDIATDDEVADRLSRVQAEEMDVIAVVNVNEMPEQRMKGFVEYLQPDGQYRERALSGDAPLTRTASPSDASAGPDNPLRSESGGAPRISRDYSKLWTGGRQSLVVASHETGRHRG